MYGLFAPGMVKAQILVDSKRSGRSGWFSVPKTCIFDRSHSWKIRTTGYGLCRKRVPMRKAASTLRTCARQICTSKFCSLRRTSTSSRTVMTNKSRSEFLHPTITPGVVVRVMLFGQNTRNMPSLFATMIALCQGSERTSSA
jgi:hypothetical protein